MENKIERQQIITSLVKASEVVHKAYLTARSIDDVPLMRQLFKLGEQVAEAISAASGRRAADSEIAS